MKRASRRPAGGPSRFPTFRSPRPGQGSYVALIDSTVREEPRDDWAIGFMVPSVNPLQNAGNGPGSHAEAKRGREPGPWSRCATCRHYRGRHFNQWFIRRQGYEAPELVLTRYLYSGCAVNRGCCGPAACDQFVQKVRATLPVRSSAAPAQISGAGELPASGPGSRPDERDATQPSPQPTGPQRQGRIPHGPIRPPYLTPPNGSEESNRS